MFEGVQSCTGYLAGLKNSAARSPVYSCALMMQVQKSRVIENVSWTP